MTRRSDERQKEIDQRIDAWANATGLGTCEDRGEGTQVKPTVFLRQREIEDLYADDGLAARIVNRPADDSTREGFDIVGTDEAVDLKALRSDLEDLGFLPALNLAAKWSRLYGGALLIPVINDGQEMDMPLNMEGIQSFDGFRVVDRFRALVDPASTLTGAGLDFEDPEFYMLTTTQRGADGKMIVGRIHKSRVIRFDGVSLPSNLIQRNQYWGASVLQHGWSNLRRLSTVRQYMEDGVHNLTGSILKVNGLTKMLKGAADSGNTSKLEKIRQGIANLRNNWNNMHWLALDKEDDLTQSNRSNAGFAEMEDVFVNGVVMDYDIPRELLVHKVEGSLSTGESGGAIRMYYDDIAAHQTNDLTPVVNRVLELYFAAHKKTVEEWEVVWRSLWKMDPKEEAEIRKLDAETDMIYFTMSAVDPAEIRQARLVEGQTGAIDMTPEIEAINGAVVDVPTDGDAPVAVALEGEGEDTPVTIEEASDPGTAFNGAQVKALSDIVLQVASKEIPFESAVQMVRIAFPVSEAEARRLLQPAKDMPKPEAPTAVEPPPVPPAPPKPGEPVADE